jgi:hypothetical protein
LQLGNGKPLVNCQLAGVLYSSSWVGFERNGVDLFGVGIHYNLLWHSFRQGFLITVHMFPRRDICTFLYIPDQC